MVRAFDSKLPISISRYFLEYSPFVRISNLNPLPRSCILSRCITINFLTILHAAEWQTTRWRVIGAAFFALLFHTLISDTRGVRCVRKMSDLNLRYGWREYFTCNPRPFLRDVYNGSRIPLLFRIGWNLFWKYICTVFLFFFSSITVGNYGKLDTEESPCIRKKETRNRRIANFQIFINR